MGSPDYDSRYEEAERRQDELIQGFLDDGILAVKAFNSCAGMVSKVEEATKVTEAFRGVLAIMRPEDSDYELPKRESILPDDLDDWNDREVADALVAQLEAMEAGAVMRLDETLILAREAQKRARGECTETIGSYNAETPPEACSAVTEPGDELCAKHRKANDAMEQHLAAEEAANPTKYPNVAFSDLSLEQ